MDAEEVDIDFGGSVADAFCYSETFAPHCETGTRGDAIGCNQNEMESIKNDKLLIDQETDGFTAESVADGTFPEVNPHEDVPNQNKTTTILITYKKVEKLMNESTDEKETSLLKRSEKPVSIAPPQMEAAVNHNPIVKFEQPRIIASNETIQSESASISSISSVSQRSKLFPTCYVQRDYSDGMEEVFKTRYPKQLLGYVSKPEWRKTIRKINELVQKGDETNFWTLLETLLEIVTCNLYGIFVHSRKKRYLKEMVEFIMLENRTIYNPKRVQISNPLLNGLRHLEIVFLDRQW